MQISSGDSAVSAAPMEQPKAGMTPASDDFRIHDVEKAEAGASDTFEQIEDAEKRGTQNTMYDLLLQDSPEAKAFRGETNPSDVPPGEEVKPAKVEGEKIKPAKTEDKEAKPSKIEAKEVKPSKTEGKEIKPAADEVKEKPSVSELPGRTPEQMQEALSEIDLKQFTQEQLEQTALDNEHRYFRNGGGEVISYAQAQREITASVAQSLDALEKSGRAVSPEQRAAILKDVSDTLLAQQAESQSRGLGNHGMPHAYGVFERMKDTPQEVLDAGALQLRQRDKTSAVTAEDLRMGMTLAAVYHDEGYLAAQARQGVNVPGNTDKLHGVDSAIAFENGHAEKYRGVVDGAVLRETTQAMAEHNVLHPKVVDAVVQSDTPQPARKDMLARIDTTKNSELDPNQGLIRSALLLSDKAALDADEKAPDVMRSPQVAAIVTQYYTMKQLGVFNEEELQTVRADMRGRMEKSVLSDPSLSQSEREKMLIAVQKDFTEESGKFNLPPASAAISRDALQFRVQQESGQPVIYADVTLGHRMDDALYLEVFSASKADEAEALSQEAAKLRGAMEDLGVIPNEKKGQPTKALYTAETVEAGRVVIDTKDTQGLSHVSVTLERVEPDTPKADVSEFQKSVETASEQVRLAHEQARQMQANQEMMRAFTDKQRAGAATREDILEVCALAYESDPEGATLIANGVRDLVRYDAQGQQTRMRALAASCTSLKLKQPNDAYQAIMRGEKA